jgi:hypothetical protein
MGQNSEFRIQDSEGRVQEFRSSGVQEFRSSGVQEFRSSGVQEFRSSGVQDDSRQNRTSKVKGSLSTQSRPKKRKAAVPF